MMDAAETRAREHFRSNTDEHEMTVLRDDGLYRHLRFNAPGTYIYGFDLVTWPGYLAIVGDVQSHLFARIDDMFKFFEGEGERINPAYWSEKLQQPDGQHSVYVYSQALYEARVIQWLEEHVDDLDGEHLTGGLEGDEAELLKAAVHEQLLEGGPPFDEREAVERLYRFEHGRLRIYEPYEWRLTEFDGHFLWCCWAIKWGIEQYRQRSEVPA